MLFEPRARLLRRHHFEELLLARGGAHARDELVLRPSAALLAHADVSHGHGLTCTLAPAAKPSLSAGTSIQPSPRVSEDSGR